MECHHRHVPPTVAIVVTLHNIEMILGACYRMPTYPCNRWRLHGLAADLEHMGREVVGFTPPLNAERALDIMRPLRNEPPEFPWSEAAALRARGDARRREGPGIDTDGLAAGGLTTRVGELTTSCGIGCIAGGAD
ncbi:unnamed protein product [Closterium sp. NIES-54]